MTGGPLAIVAAGGTGGHMFPAQALSETLLRRGWRVILSTDSRGARYTAGFPDAVVIETVSSATPARGGIIGRVMAAPRIGLGVMQAARRMRSLNPAVVIGFGGYPSIPAIGAATLLKLPRMIHEQNGILGQANRLFAPRVDLVACGTWPTDLPAEVAAEYVGNPVRAAVRDRAGAAYIPPGDYPMSILVIGGSQGARILSDRVPGAIGRLPAAIRANLRVAHQAREEDADRVAEAYDAAGVTAEVETFFDDVPRRLSEAQLVVSRSGASSVADIAAIGRPSILIPYAAAAGDHQTANARGLAEEEAAVVIPEKRFSEEALAANMEAILSQPDAAEGMARAALSLGRPDAADTLADLAETLAEERRRLDKSM